MSIYDVLTIEKRRDGTFFVLDKRGPNVVSAGPFTTMKDAQNEWSRQADHQLRSPTHERGPEGR